MSIAGANAAITGKVIDAITSNPIEGATVSVKTGNKNKYQFFGRIYDKCCTGSQLSISILLSKQTNSANSDG